MFKLALPRGQASAYPDLPPTLRPHAVLDLAPRADPGPILAGCAGIYLLLAVAVWFAPQAAPLAPGLPKPTEGPTRVFDPPQRILDRLPRLILPAAPAHAGPAAAVPAGPAAPVRAEPTDVGPPAAGLPTTDRSREAVGGPAGTGPAATAAPGSAGPAGVGTTLDLGSTGLGILKQVEPAYPELARRARIQGPVVLAMTVDPQGVPIQVEVLEGHPVFHTAALAAARQWRFEPARVEGQPVKALFKLTLKFTLR